MYIEETKLDHVGFWSRFAEYCIDICPAFLLSTIPHIGFILDLCYIVWNFILFQKKTGQTIGKRTLGYKLVREDGSPLTYGLVIGRFFALMLNSLILYIGWMMTGWTKKKQGLHDKLCGTYVVRGGMKWTTPKEVSQGA